MAEEERNVHPGSWLGDAAEEFKKMPPWGKALAIGAVILVAYLGYRAFAANKSSTISGTSQTGSTLSSGDVASGQDTGSGTQSPFALVPAGPTAGSVPVVPQGLQPVFDGVGNLIGWTPGTTTPASTAASPTPSSTTTTTGTTPPTNAKKVKASVPVPHVTEHKQEVRTPLHRTSQPHLQVVSSSDRKPVKPTIQPHYKQTQPPQHPRIG